MCMKITLRIFAVLILLLSSLGAIEQEDRFVVHKDLVYSEVNGGLTLDLFLPDEMTEKVPCILVIQGGGFRPQNGQKFRPFAPAILEEYADEYFDGPMNEYMQFVAKAKHDYSSVTHIDGTARVQVVKKDCSSVIRRILEEWYDKTGCPMLLNTSLNIKGKPMVDTWDNAVEFSKLYNVKIF